MFQSKLVRRRRASADQQLLSSTLTLTSGSHEAFKFPKKKIVRFNCADSLHVPQYHGLLTFRYFDPVIPLTQFHSFLKFKSALSNLPSKKWNSKKTRATLSHSSSFSPSPNVRWSIMKLLGTRYDMVGYYVFNELNEYWNKIMNRPLFTCAAKW